jgi:hypothetical protein
VASESHDRKPVLETFTENHLCKRKVAGECSSPATFVSSTTYIFRIAILLGVTCHFLEIYIWNVLKKMAGIEGVWGLDISFFKTGIERKRRVVSGGQHNRDSEAAIGDEET